MTLTLTIIRHAKSAWGDPAIQDLARPLNDRGRRSADALGRWLAGRANPPTHALCSPATRTRETWERIAAALDTPTVDHLDALYGAGPDLLLAAIASAAARSLALVGHNPGIAAFADAMAWQRPNDSRFLRYPTGATTVLTFEAEGWDDVGPGTGKVTDFVVPRDLI